MIREIVAIDSLRPAEAVPVIGSSDRPVGKVPEADVLAKPELHGGGGGRAVP